MSAKKTNDVDPHQYYPVVATSFLFSFLVSRNLKRVMLVHGKSCLCKHPGTSAATEKMAKFARQTRMQCCVPAKFFFLSLGNSDPVNILFDNNLKKNRGDLSDVSPKTTKTDHALDSLLVLIY